MSNNSSHGKNNTSLFRKLRDTSSYTKNKHNKSKTKKRNEIISTTPPLPEGKASIDETKNNKQKITRNEMSKLSKSSDGNLEKYMPNNFEKGRNDSKRHAYKNNLRKKRSREYEDDNLENNKRIAALKDTSPESPGRKGDEVQIDSEDEDNIIENRRQQRKELLEKFNKAENKTENYIHKNIFTISQNNEYTPTPKTKEIPNITVKKTPDMFSDKDDFSVISKTEHIIRSKHEQSDNSKDNWDDLDGYYNIKSGEAINNNRYIIKNILGKGVYSNVVRADDTNQSNTEVAIKIIRHNELMFKSGLKEISILKEIAMADPENKHHCIKLHSYFKHRGHLCIVLEPLCMDLRTVAAKYSKYHGLSMQALMSYTKQLFVALKLLKKIGVVHADIKPDNVLVNERKNVLKLCDFGSAIRINDGIGLTDYLVSRFYRAPEIILGVPYKHSVDIWSAACTLYEMATSKILFTGSSNNNMLKCFMDLKGKFPIKLINKSRYKDKHFNDNNIFLLHIKDELTGKDTMIEITNVTIHRNLQKELIRSHKHLSDNGTKKLAQFKDLLDKMLTLDLSQRLTITDCLKHSFISDRFQK